MSRPDLNTSSTSSPRPDSHGVIRASICAQSATTKDLPLAGMIAGRSIPFRTSVTLLPYAGTIEWPLTIALLTESGSFAHFLVKLWTWAP